MRGHVAGLALVLSSGTVMAVDTVDEGAIDPAIDYHSYANIDQFRVTHMELDLRVWIINGSASKSLDGFVALEIKRLDPNATELVLDTKGGALAKMLPAFRLGVAGKLGSGHQWWSWISLRDAARAYVFTLENDVSGALNLASPTPVTSAEFTRTLGRVLHRPTLFGVPAFALRAVAGEMAEEMFLASQRVLPKRLLELGFGFEDVELEPTLRKLLR